jgi:hypothetical protein
MANTFCERSASKMTSREARREGSFSWEIMVLTSRRVALMKAR